MLTNFDEMFSKSLEEHLVLVDLVRSNLSLSIKRASVLLADTFLRGNKLIIVGNGGSAADAQHIASEFTGRFLKERDPLPAISLTTDSSALTAIANDYSYESVFSRQVTAIGAQHDTLLAISTSGKSVNIINAVKAATEKGMMCIALTGNDGGDIVNLCQINVVVPSKITARIQEMHILIGHLFCEYIDTIDFNANKPSTTGAIGTEAAS